MPNAVEVKNGATLRAIANIAEGDKGFTVGGNVPAGNLIANARIIAPLKLTPKFVAHFQNDDAAPQNDTTDNVQNVTPRFARIVAGSGRNGGAAFVIEGKSDDATHAYIYYRAFDNLNIPVTPDTILRHWMEPETKEGARTGLDLTFTDGSNLRDSAARTLGGNALHPGEPRGAVGSWTRIESPIGKWLAGKTIKSIDFAYDAQKPDGTFRASFDDIEIGEPK